MVQLKLLLANLLINKLSYYYLRYFLKTKKLITKKRLEMSVDIPEEYLELYQTSMMKVLVKIFKSLKQLTICVKSFVIDVLRGRKYTSVYHILVFKVITIFIITLLKCFIEMN